MDEREWEEVVVENVFGGVNAMFRPDLTDYEGYIQILTDKLNEESLLKMSKTDAVKIAIEKALQNLVPDVVVNKKRKIYQCLEF